MARRTGPTPSATAVLRVRARGRCEICSIHLKERGAHAHHRKPRGMGGSKKGTANLLSNLLWLCPFDHLQMVESRRAKSYKFGWLVYSGDDPATQPVKLWDGWFLLTDDGLRVSVPAPVAGPNLSDRGGSG